MRKEFVNAVSTGDNLGAEGAFKDAITAKVGDALETKEKKESKPSDVTHHIHQAKQDISKI